MDAIFWIFWFLILLIVYPYLIYPLLIKMLADRFPYKCSIIADHKEWPVVTFIISAYNEENVIAKKLENTLALSYPRGNLQIFVVSDASEDRTDDIVRTIGANDNRITLIRQEERKGKSSGLNLALAKAGGEVVVFSDANAIYKNDALYELVRPFGDPKIGYVVGSARYFESDGNKVKESEGLYWKFELWLKEKESAFYSVIGGDGAIYAIRRNLFTELQQDDINDFVNPLQIISYGYRGIFNSNAVCYEEGADEFGKEFSRKRRIVNRTWRAVTRYLPWLSLKKQARYIFMLVSHKLLRWYGLLLIFFALSLNTLIMINRPNIVYAVTITLILMFFLIALIGAFLLKRELVVPRFFYIAYYFFSVHLSALLGIFDEFRGVRHVTWQHIRKMD